MTHVEGGASRRRLSRDHAEEAYIRAGEVEVFRQLQRDAEALDVTMADERAFALGPFARLKTDVVLGGLGKTRGAINHLWGSQEAFRAAVMHVFLNDDSLGVDEVQYPAPADHATLDDWIVAWAATEIERGPRHGMAPQSSYGMRWAAWLGLVPYGIWSTTVSTTSNDEFRAGSARLAHDVLAPALVHFERRLVDGTSIDQLAVAVSTTIEGTWLTACLTEVDPLDGDDSIATTLARSLGLLVRGATTA